MARFPWAESARILCSSPLTPLLGWNFVDMSRLPVLARAVVGAVALACGSGAGAALAQHAIFVPQLDWPGLSQDDAARMHAAAARLYEGRSIGTVERWRSPASNDAGEVKLLESFDVRGMPCRTIDYTIRFDTNRDSPDHYVINWCRVQGGVWKIVEVVPPRCTNGCPLTQPKSP